jgi:hypothetical protein
MEVVPGLYPVMGFGISGVGLSDLLPVREFL